jgi:ElaB/YqjD/DUF883 family membrane-anchored ribosome-binding protein
MSAARTTSAVCVRPEDRALDRRKPAVSEEHEVGAMLLDRVAHDLPWPPDGAVRHDHDAVRGERGAGGADAILCAHDQRFGCIARHGERRRLDRVHHRDDRASARRDRLGPLQRAQRGLREVDGHDDPQLVGCKLRVGGRWLHARRRGCAVVLHGSLLEIVLGEDARVGSTRRDAAARGEVSARRVRRAPRKLPRPRGSSTVASSTNPCRFARRCRHDARCPGKPRTSAPPTRTIRRHQSEGVTPMDRNSATMSDEASDLYREIDRLKSDLRQLRTDAGTLGGDAMRTARAGLNETVRTATAQGKAAVAGAEKRITDHPFLSVGAAFALGLFLGYRVTRRN